MADAEVADVVDFGPLVDRAWQAHHRRDWPEALRRWEALQLQFPDRAVGFAGAISTQRSSGDAQAAIRVVNAEEANPNACAIMNVAYMRGTQVGMARHGENTFEIVHILVVGVETGNGILPVRPAAYFSLFEVREYGV